MKTVVAILLTFLILGCAIVFAVPPDPTISPNFWRSATQRGYSETKVNRYNLFYGPTGFNSPIWIGDPPSDVTKDSLLYIDTEPSGFEYAMYFATAMPSVLEGSLSVLGTHVLTLPERVVVVDKDGHGDFTGIKAAADYVATQPRSYSSGWRIVVNPGEYTEVSMTLPSNVDLECGDSNTGADFYRGVRRCSLSLTGTTGTLLTFGDGGQGLTLSSISRFDIFTPPVNTTGDVVVIGQNVLDLVLKNVFLASDNAGTFAKTLLLINGMTSIDDCLFVRGAHGTETNAVGIYVTSTGELRSYGTIITRYGGSEGTGLFVEASGKVFLTEVTFRDSRYYASSLSTWGTDIANSGTVRALNSQIFTSSGTAIIDSTQRSWVSAIDTTFTSATDKKLTISGAFGLTPSSSPPIPCAVGEAGIEYFDSDIGKKCICNGTNYVLASDDTTTTGCS